MAVVYLGLGSSMGEKEEYLKNAVQMLQRNLGMFLSLSSIYESEAWGYTSENTFYNIVAKFDTEHTPEEVLNITSYIENYYGRTRSEQDRYSDRTLDIDILYYGAEIIQTERLTVPHPRVLERHFTVVPLLEIEPEMKDPLSGSAIADICQELLNSREITRVRKITF